MHKILVRFVAVFMVFCLLSTSISGFAQPNALAELKEIKAQMKQDEESLRRRIGNGILTAVGYAWIGTALAISAYVVVKGSANSSLVRRREQHIHLLRKQRQAADKKALEEALSAIPSKSAVNAESALSAKANFTLEEKVLDLTSFKKSYSYNVSNLYRHYYTLADGTTKEGLLYQVRPERQKEFLKEVQQIVKEELDKLPEQMKVTVLKGDKEYLRRHLDMNTKIKKRISAELRHPRFAGLITPVTREKFIVRKAIGRVSKWAIRLFPLAILAIILDSSAAKAQEKVMAERIQKNFLLVAHSTEEEEKLIASSELLMEASRSIAQHLHELVQLPDEELEEVIAVAKESMQTQQGEIREKMASVAQY